MKFTKPLILSVLASVGVIGTAVSSAYAGKRAEKKQTKKEKVICYIPTAFIGASTIACIFSSYGVSQKKQESLIAAYSLLQSSFNDYKQAVIDVHGEEAHERVMEHIVKEEIKQDVCLSAPSMFGNTTLDIFGSSVPEVVRTFYDAHSNRYFESTLSKVIQAEYHVNRNFALGSETEVDDFYEFLGLEPLHTDCAIGWNMEDDYYWIDFNHHLNELDDGMEVVAIEMIFEPGPLG